MVCMGNVHAGLKCPIVSLEIYSYCEDVCCDYFYFNIIFSLLFFTHPSSFFLGQIGTGRDFWLTN